MTLRQAATPSKDGSRYVELREAVDVRRARIEATGLSAQAWLDRRWDELNATRPPGCVRGDLGFGAFRGPRDSQLVPVPQIVTGSGESRWGALGYRSDAHESIVQGLLDNPFPAWFNRMGAVSLLQYEGPRGPTYSVCSDGHHRLHTVKALDLPYVNARVEDIRTHPMPSDELAGSNVAHMNLLVALGAIRDFYRGSYSATGVLAYEIPVPWALESPEKVCLISRSYADVYPEFRRDRFYALTSSYEVAATMEYLTEFAPDTARAERVVRQLRQREPVSWRQWVRRLLSREGAS